MDYIYIWVVIAAVALIVEILTVNLVSVWFVIGALVSFLSAKLGAPIGVQIFLFVAVSAFLLLIIMPRAKRYIDKRKTATNSDRIIGETAVVTEEINNLDAKGQIKVLGSIWSARTEDGSVIEKDTEVTVVGISGVKAIVKNK